MEVVDFTYLWHDLLMWSQLVPALPVAMAPANFWATLIYRSAQQGRFLEVRNPQGERKTEVMAVYGRRSMKLHYQQTVFFAAICK